MARPRVRTATLSPDDVQELRRLFGTVTNAYTRLMPGGTPLTWAVFRVAAGGRPVRPEDLAAFKRTLAEWRKANLKARATA